jgi:hypothetical protein
MDADRPSRPEVLPDGSLRAPDGVVYRSTPRRVTRKVGRELVESGAAVVTDIYPDGLCWYEGGAALEAWQEIEPDLVVGRRPPPRDTQWVGHVWESDDGRRLLRFDGQH